MRSLLLLACSCCILALASACHRVAPSKTVSAPHLDPPIPWQPAQIQDLRIALQDENKVEEMAFADRGLVAMTVGSKQALTAPIFNWKLREGILVITSAENSPYEELALISLSPTTLVARRKNGALATYSVKSSSHP